MSGFALHPAAFADVDEICEFIAQDSLDAADRVVADMFDAMARLAASPEQGHRRPELTPAPLLFWRVHSYLIAYAPAERPLWVVAVIHGHRSPRMMAAILQQRQ